MGFIERVKERATHKQDYDRFKRLWPSYTLVDSVGIPRPKVYATLSKDELAKATWAKLQHRVPNIFVMRPTLFVSPSHDFLMRDDGVRGLMNFTKRSQQSADDALKNQMNFLANMVDNASMLIEEFPLTFENLLCYPVHYRVHVFGGVIGCIQGTTMQDLFWLDTDCKIMASQGNKDASSLIPHVGTMDDICSAAKAVSLVTKLPYTRIDFVASTRGAMFRGFACIPGDVMSNDHNWFYRQHNDTFEKLWTQAENAIGTGTKEEVHDNSQESPVDTPHDNA